MSNSNEYMDGYMDSQLSWILRNEYNMSSCEVDSIMQSITSMKATSSVKVSYFKLQKNSYYQDLTIFIPEDNKTFIGQCGGSSGADVEGYGYTWAEDMNFQALYNNTKSFIIINDIGFTRVCFCNENKKVIGMLNSSASNSSCHYDGSGSGKWS